MGLTDPLELEELQLKLSSFSGLAGIGGFRTLIEGLGVPLRMAECPVTYGLFRVNLVFLRLFSSVSSSSSGVFTQFETISVVGSPLACSKAIKRKLV